MPYLGPAEIWVNTKEEWVREQALQELRSACEASDCARVRELYTKPPYDAVVDYCIQVSTPNTALLHSVLEDGASPDRHAQKESTNSKDTLEPPAEFGHEIKLRGYLLLQYFAHSREIVDWMLDRGVDIGRTDYGRTEDGFRLASPRDLKALNSVGIQGDIELYDHLIARGADQSRSLALHCASKCQDAAKSTAMIDHLLDKYHMDIEFESEKLRDNFDTVGDSGTPLDSVVYHQNLAAIHKLLARGYLRALRPLLDAGADLDHAFDWAVEWGNIEAAHICLERGADRTDALEKQRFWDDKTAAALNAEEVEMVTKERAVAERLPWRKISRDMQVFLRSIRNDGPQSV